MVKSKYCKDFNIYEKIILTKKNGGMYEKNVERVQRGMNFHMEME